MIGFWPLLKKEMKEQVRTFKLPALFLALLLLGIGGIVLLVFLPDILRMSGDTSGVVIPEFSTKDALASYHSNIVQIGLLTVVVISMGSVARERERKTALIILSKPVSVAAYVGAKLVAYVTSVVLTVAILGLVAWVYAVQLFDGSVTAGGMLAMIGTEALFLSFVAAVTIGVSCMFGSQLPAAVLALVLLLALTATAGLPVVGAYLPGAVTGWGLALMQGTSPEPRWAALVLTLAVGAIVAAAGWWRLSTTEV